jgi:mannose-1-phosphate guanylyltransferase/mannose-6-phosphate isomerase
MLKTVAPQDLFIVTSNDYFHEVLREAPEISDDQIILEPEAKNTAPAIALTIKMLKERGVSGSDVIFVTPSDHVVAPIEKFVEALKEGENLAKKGSIVTFGVRPQGPETGYGYLLAKEGKVEKFIEKPNKEKALEYISSGNYFWNAGYFAFTLETMEKELKRHLPETKAFFSGGPFSQLPKISLDYAVMEKTENVEMIPLDLTWSDVGSWDSVYDLFDRDANGNVIQGEVQTVDTHNSLLFSKKRLLATIGVSDLLVVETDDVILIAKKEEGQKVKEMVENLKAKGKSEVEVHVTTHRPWGSYTVLEEGERFKIKRIRVLPLAKLSLQLHYHRSEHWIVVTGTARVTINDEEKIVHEGESIFVPKSAVHRVENPGKVPLEIIEVQVGEYLGEDDIVRLEDIYGRLKESAVFDVLKNAVK